ncbi:hypothetical protein HDU96_010010 [Phlyctochytrium bullatum]|nr:hypothetical protein HDU96_010010 [Phlyctochytrium bullatum]
MDLGLGYAAHPEGRPAPLVYPRDIFDLQPRDGNFLQSAIGDANLLQATSTVLARLSSSSTLTSSTSSSSRRSHAHRAATVLASTAFPSSSGLFSAPSFRILMITVQTTSTAAPLSPTTSAIRLPATTTTAVVILPPAPPVPLPSTSPSPSPPGPVVPPSPVPPSTSIPYSPPQPSPSPSPTDPPVPTPSTDEPEERVTILPVPMPGDGEGGLPPIPTPNLCKNIRAFQIVCLTNSTYNYCLNEAPLFATTQTCHRRSICCPSRNQCLGVGFDVFPSNTTTTTITTDSSSTSLPSTPPPDPLLLALSRCAAFIPTPTPTPTTSAGTGPCASRPDGATVCASDTAFNVCVGGSPFLAVPAPCPRNRTCCGGKCDATCGGFGVSRVSGAKKRSGGWWGVLSGVVVMMLAVVGRV